MPAVSLDFPSVPLTLARHLEFGPGVYSIRNVTTGERYIGAASEMKSRARHHLSLLRRDKHYSAELQAAVNSSGLESFVMEVLERCEVEDLSIREIYWHRIHQPTYCKYRPAIRYRSGEHLRTLSEYRDHVEADQIKPPSRKRQSRTPKRTAKLSKYRFACAVVYPHVARQVFGNGVVEDEPAHVE